MELVYEDETYVIRGAIYEVYKSLGTGFLEAVYQEALEMELAERGIPFRSQAEIPVYYKERTLRQAYRADIICYSKIILELKAVRQLLPEHAAQLQNYLRATGLKVGLLVNFCNSKGAEIQRIIC